MPCKTSGIPRRAMRMTHGSVPPCAVSERRYWRYRSAMKPQPHRNLSSRPDADRSPTATRTTREREVSVVSVRTPPPVPHRRYPSLSDDGQPYLPSLRRHRPIGTLLNDASHGSRHSDTEAMPSVRTLALLALVVIIVVLLMFVARPLAVLISLSPFKVPLKEQVLVSWCGLRGAVPIVLATFPLLAGTPRALETFNIVFFVVLVSTLLQGTTIRVLNDRLFPKPSES